MATPRQKMMRRVTTLRSKQYGEYRLSAINYSRESIKNREYLTKFKANFEKSLKNEEEASEESISEKIRGKKSRWPALLNDFLRGFLKIFQHQAMLIPQGLLSGTLVMFFS
jgi:hypothetical protein